MDDDGVTIGQRIPIRVRVTVDGDQMTIDLTDVSRQVTGFYNSGETAGRSGGAGRVQVPDLAAATCRSTTARSRRSRSSCRRAAWSARVKPAAMRMWMTIPMTVVDTIFKALAPAIPERVIAGHHADLVRRPHQRHAARSDGASTSISAA